MTGVYVSVPFCRQKCTYCNFASEVYSEGLRIPYCKAVCREIRQSDFPGDSDTLYLGGGTPSLLATEDLAELLSALPRHEWREATLEASPGTVTAEKAEAWVRLGLNRVSLGVQSFVPREALASGRKHTPEQVVEEVNLLRRAGMAAINLDLIAGLAYQTNQSWRTSLDWIERLAPEHVSVYMLEVDDDSRLGEELRAGGTRYGAAHTPSEDAIADFYLLAVERLAVLGIFRYEISNFARPGCESRHNLKYWNMEPYLGFGADAHSFDGVRRWWNVTDAAGYIARSEKGEGVRAGEEPMGAERLRQDRFLTGLRQAGGIRPTADEIAFFREPLRRLQGQGWLEVTSAGFLRLTSEGILFSNNVFAEFLAEPATAMGLCG
jgi:oxygen-independent coproporphyrinogen-3 oxidase